MENKRMRCHFSIVLEQCWGVLLFFILMLFTNIRDAAEFLASEEGRGGKLIAFFVFFGVILVLLIFHFFRWRKTTIMIDGNTLVWERDTLNKKKLTIQIKNISSINLERGIFQSLLGTTRVKIDTNSLSTANQTDLNLLFSKAVAEELKKTLEAKRKQSEEGVSKEHEVKESGAEETDAEYGVMSGRTDEEGVQFTSGISDILMHSLYDLSLAGVLLVFSGILAFAGAFAENLKELEEVSAQDVVGMVGALFAVFCLIFSFLASIVKKFFTYYDLTSARKGNYILLTYGLLKRREYTLPVETINAVIIRQRLFGRIFKKYHASMECIGVGDESGETAQLTLCLSYEEMLERLHLLLPEYELDALEESRPVPKKAFWHKLCGNIHLIYLALIAFIIIEAFSKNGLRVETPEWIAMGVFLFLLLCNCIRIMLNMKTEKLGFGENFIALTTGGIAKTTAVLDYHKLQYAEYRASPLTKITGLYSGMVHILSKASGSVYRVPMLYREQIEKIKEKCLK